MKKFFSLLLGTLLVLPMLAQDKVITFDKTDFAGKGVVNTGGPVTVTKEGVTFSCDKGYGDGQYGVRCYAGSKVTISAEENIKSIEFEFGLDKTGGLDALTPVGSKEWTSTLPSQARMNTIKVTLGEGTVEVPTIEEITPERAKEIGMALADNATTPVKYIVKGYVTYAKDYSTQYNNQDFYMASDAASDNKDNFCAYHTVIDAPGTKVGDLVTVEGKITKYVGDYGTTIEIKNGVGKIISAGTAVPNITVAEKAVKVLGEDGQVYIIRNGVKYNALGTVVE